MTAEDGLRFIAYEADWCRTKDEAEAICLLLPPLLVVLGLEPMNGYEAEVFRAEVKAKLMAARERARAEAERTRI